MTIRPLQNCDLKVTKSFADSHGRQRCSVSLAGCGFVNKTYWLTEADQVKPETLARVKAELQSIAARKLEALRKFAQ